MIIGSPSDAWNYEFVVLPVYKAGKKVSYTVLEKPVSNYTATINGFDITNTVIPPVASPKTGDVNRDAIPKVMAVLAIVGIASVA